MTSIAQREAADAHARQTFANRPDILEEYWYGDADAFKWPKIFRGVQHDGTTIRHRHVVKRNMVGKRVTITTSWGTKFTGYLTVTDWKKPYDSTKRFMGQPPLRIARDRDVTLMIVTGKPSKNQTKNEINLQMHNIEEIVVH